jgi:hypothetical protein
MTAIRPRDRCCDGYTFLLGTAGLSVFISSVLNFEISRHGQNYSPEKLSNLSTAAGCLNLLALISIVVAATKKANVFNRAEENTLPRYASNPGYLLFDNASPNA